MSRSPSTGYSRASRAGTTGAGTTSTSTGTSTRTSAAGRGRGVQRAATETPFFHSKLRAPVPPDHVVSRPRLVELLDDLTTRAVTLVVAPAGAGKTVLVADWAGRSATPTSWLSIDDADSDGSRLWTGVIAALEAHVPGCGTEATAILRGHRGALSAVHALVAALEDVEREPLVLVLDDLQRALDAPGVDVALEAFVEHLPAWLHLVLVSRQVPPLRVERLQAAGRLAEVRFAQLRCSVPESVQVLTALAPGMSEEAVEKVASRSGGWVAALQLAGLAARVVDAAPEVSSSADERDRLVDEYLWHEVFGSERPEVVDVLLDTAVVERVNAHLATALTGRPDAYRVLIEAEARGLFVRRLDAVGWFEVHALVREALLHEAARRSPGRLAAQHERAARWFEEAGETTAALDHWVAADRPRDALALLARSAATMYDEGQDATIQRVLALVPSDVAAADLDALLDLAWCQLYVDRDAFAVSVREAAALAGAEGTDPDGTGPHGRLTVLQAVAALADGDWAGAQRQASRALEALAADGGRDAVGRYAWNVRVRALALAEEWDDGGPAVREARAAIGRDVERLLTFEGTRALGTALAGRPVDALRIAAGVDRTASQANLSVLRLELALAQALAHRELGDRARAEQELTELVSAPGSPAGHVRAIAGLGVVEARLSAGDLDAAVEAFDRVRTAVLGEHRGAGARTWLARVGLRLALAGQDLERARAWVDQVEDPFWAPLGAARVLVATGDPTAAARLADEAEPRCVRHEVLRGLLLAQVEPSGERAGKLVATAVEAAAETGLLQTFADEGPHVVELVERSAWVAPQEWLDRLRRAALPSQPVSPGLVETLTARELDVLRLLPSRLTQREIADELFVSVNTLKFHLRIIYRKLGVGSRSEAATIANAWREAGRHGGVPGQSRVTFRR